MLHNQLADVYSIHILRSHSTTATSASLVSKSILATILFSLQCITLDLCKLLICTTTSQAGMSDFRDASQVPIITELQLLRHH